MSFRLGVAVWLGVFVAAYPAQAHAFFWFAAIPIAMQIAATVATAAISATTAIMTAVQKKKQADREAAQHKINANQEATRTLQRDTVRRKELARSLGTIRAARGGKGVVSPTATAFLDEANEEINSDRIVEYINGVERMRAELRRAADAKRRGRRALITGALKAGNSLFTAFASSFGGGGGGTGGALSGAASGASGGTSSTISGGASGAISGIA